MQRRFMVVDGTSAQRRWGVSSDMVVIVMDCKNCGSNVR
jgi:hypothetical protein